MISNSIVEFSYLDVITLIPFLSSMFFHIILMIYYLKDRDKRKLMFAIGIGLASINWLKWYFESLQYLQFFVENGDWFSFPIILATSIIAYTSLYPEKDFDNLFHIFLALTGLSFLAQLLNFFAPIRVFIFFPLAFFSLSIMVYQFVRWRRASDVFFLLALFCFMMSGVFYELNQSAELVAFFTLFGIIHVGLMFFVEPSVEGVSTFFSVRTALEKTQKELEVTQKQLVVAERFATIGKIASMISHDLRNPLNSIQSATYLLGTGIIEEKSNDVENMLSLINRNVNYSNSIIEELLDFSREIHLETAPITPVELVRDVFNVVEIPENIKIENLLAPAPLIYINEFKMRRVLENLVKNAVDAMTDGGSLALSQRLHEDKLDLIIKDTGVGMSQETLENLWIPLYTTKKEGMGLGLCICKRIIDAHGGTISVNSKVDVGTTFTISLPLQSTLI